MSKLLMVNPDKCTSCRTCELMCSFEHTKTFNPSLSAVTVIECESALTSVPVMCMQCDEACCLAVCPVKAISRSECGTVTVNPDKCIVCKMCVSACPLGSMKYIPDGRKVFKCDLCGGEPKCVQYCPSGALEFVDPAEVPNRKKILAERFKEVFGEEASS